MVYFNMQCVFIFQIILKLFIHNVFLIDTMYDLKYQNNFILWALNIKNTHNVDDMNYGRSFCVSKKYNPILLNQNRYKAHLPYQKNNNRFGIQLENNVINILYFYNKKNQSVTNKQRMLYFLQLGMQNLLTNKTINLGIGKRYIQNNLYGIGYNIICNIPVFKNNIINLPYSMNIGGEYWYKNFFVALNGYYNLNKILYLDKLIDLDILKYPDVGYQICIQSILPYISDFRTQIKLEKFYHIQEMSTLFNNHVDNNFYSLSVGLGYKPNSILDFSIDNVFNKNKCTDILFKVSLNYQFNTLFFSQVKQKNYHNKLLNLDNLYSSLKFFNPKVKDIKVKDDTYNMSKTMYKIIGYSKETKYIKINNNPETFLKWYTKSLEQNGGNIVSLTKDLYKIRLPKYNSVGNNKFFLAYEERDKNNTMINKQKILILVEKFPQINVDAKTYDNSVITIQDAHSSHNANNTSLLITTYDKVDPNKQETSHASSDTNTEISNVTPVFCSTINDINQVQEKKELDNDIIVHDAHHVIPVPPPIPKLFDCAIPSNLISVVNENATLVYSQKNDSISLESSSYRDQPIADKAFSTSSSIRKKDNSDENIVNTPIDNIYNINKNFSSQLLMQKKFKFSSIGTEEYMNKLESSIVQRKNTQYTTEIGKIFKQLHKSFSYSSVEESLDTDNDNTDSFSESSKN